MSKRLAAVVVLGLSASAHATPIEDLAFATQEMNHDKVSGWVVERMVTLTLPEKCWAKVLDKKNMGHTLWSNFARSIQTYARNVTGDDWAKLEGQSANSKEANQAMVDKLVKDFQPKFHLTLVYDGDDCDATGNALWLKYISTTLSALNSYPPKSGKALVTIHVEPKVKAVKTEVSKDGTTFTITAPRDQEVSGWPSDVEGPIKRVSTKN